MDMSLVVVRARVFPTEDREKVRQAMLNLFPGGEVHEEEGAMELHTDDLARFKERIRSQRILDAVRSMLRHGMRESESTILLNKQVAFVGKVSEVEGIVPLGALEVTFRSSDIERLIDEVAPMTVNGEEPR